MRKSYIWREGKLVERGEDEPLKPRIYVIQDSMDAVAHPCTGKRMDSKSEFRRITRAHGCVEIGNEKPKPRDTVAHVRQGLPPMRESIRDALAQLEGKR